MLTCHTPGCGPSRSLALHRQLRVHIPRTVLEWRLDPESPWRNPHVGSLDQQIVLICDHGCSSILAAATLVELGFARAGDVVGGFAAWRDAGLPGVRPSRRERHAS